ncbi:MAG: hypothetical protein WC779_00830 [Candidatus Omnitrophota bacterium]|jgi:hypothetical protein
MGKRARLKKLNKMDIREKPSEAPSAASIDLDPRIKNIIILALFIAILAIGINLRIINLNNVERRSPDEGIYTYQANTVAKLGAVQGVKTLINDYNSDQKFWIYPPPSRVGYIWALAGVMKLTGIMNEKAGAYISTAFSILSLILLIVLGLRFFNPWATLAGLLLMSVSPMDLAIARRSWQDAMFGFMGLGLIYLASELGRNAKQLLWILPFAALGSYTVLIKEPGVVIYGLCGIWLCWVLFVREKLFLNGSILIICGALGAAVSLFLLTNAAGGLAPVLQVIKHVKEAMPTNVYAIDYQSGPWYQFIQGFWIMSPVSIFLCVIGVAGILMPKNTFFPDTGKRHELIGILSISAAFFFIAIMTPYCQNLRYVSVLYAPFYLLGGLGFWYTAMAFISLFKNIPVYAVIAVLALTLAAASVSDYANFKKIIVKTGILDVSIRMIREQGL